MRLYHEDGKKEVDGICKDGEMEKIYKFEEDFELEEYIVNFKK